MKTIKDITVNSISEVSTKLFDGIYSNNTIRVHFGEYTATFDGGDYAICDIASKWDSCTFNVFLSENGKTSIWKEWRTARGLVSIIRRFFKVGNFVLLTRNEYNNMLADFAK